MDGCRAQRAGVRQVACKRGGHGRRPHSLARPVPPFRLPDDRDPPHDLSPFRL